MPRAPRGSGRGAAGAALPEPAVHTAAARALRVIRAAASRELCVDLDYVDESGRRALRRIEPHALRRSRDGHLVLHALRAGGFLHRAYRVDRIRGARLTRQRFTPRYPIEMGPDDA